MPRIQFSDVTPPGKRSIRNIPIPNSGRRKAPVIIKPEPEEEPVRRVESMPDSRDETTENRKVERYNIYSGKSRRKQFVFGTIIFVLVAVFIVSMMTVFASASIEITPKSQEISVDMKITGSIEAEKGAVRYEIIKLSKSETASVPAAGEEVAEIKASGKIVVYNNFSTEPQRLIVRTRFESSGGLIYRISESITIPGKSVKNGVETPGSTEVEVFADEAGEKYNIKKSDFTLPGFKSDADRYKKFYARSSTEMTGGFIGKRKTVLPVDKEAALQNIDSEAQTGLKKDLDSKVPEGLVLLPGSITYKSRELPAKDEGSSVLIGKEVTAYAVMLNAQDLSGKITGEYISELPGWNNIKPIIKDFSLLNVAGLSDNLEANSKMDLQINGKTKVWAYIDTDAIGQRLLGVPKKDAAKLINEYAGISSVKSAVRPVWKRSFPKDSFKIHVKTTIDE